MHHGIHTKKRNLILIRLPTQLTRLNHRFTGDDKTPGRLGLLHIRKRQPADPGGALPVGGLDVDDGHVRIDGRHQHDLVDMAPSVEGVVHDRQLAVRKVWIISAGLFGETPNSGNIRAQR